LVMVIVFSPYRASRALYLIETMLESRVLCPIELP
jgi:hypothetical protein